MADEQAPRPKSKWAAFSREEKAGFLVFGVVGVFGLVLSSVYLFDHIRAPFSATYTGKAFETISERERREIEEQKKMDSDGDGLSDYDEVAVYQTSQYLADSDSDGLDDGREVKSGDNPNCPAGKACAGAEGAARPFTATDLTAGATADLGGLTGEIRSAEDLERYLNALSVPQIRTALIESGIKKETIDALSDDEVRVLYDEALKELSKSGKLDDIANQNP